MGIVIHSNVHRSGHRLHHRSSNLWSCCPSFVEQRWKSAGRTNTFFFLLLLSSFRYPNSVKTMNTSLFVLLLQLYVAAASTTDLTGNHATHSATKEFQEFCASKAAQLYEFYIDTFQMSENWSIDVMLLLFVSICLLYVCARFHRSGSYSLVLYLKWIALQYIIANVWSSVVVNQTPLPLLNLFVFVCLLIWIFTAVNNDKLPNDSIEQSDRIEHGWYSKVSLLLSVAIVGLFLHY